MPSAGAEERRPLKVEDDHWHLLKEEALCAGAEQGMCIRWFLCLQKKKLPHITEWKIPFLVLGKWIQRKMLYFGTLYWQSFVFYNGYEAKQGYSKENAKWSWRDLKQSIFHFKYCYKGEKNPLMYHILFLKLENGLCNWEAKWRTNTCSTT